MNLSYEDFKGTKAIRPSSELSEKVLSQVYQDFHPNPWKIFSKLSLIHFGVGLLTLSICPQFNVQLLGDGMGLMEVFMGLGPYGCMIACGSFFLGMSVLTASLLFRPEELRQLKKNGFLQISALILVSFGIFIMARADIVFGFAIAWAFGSLMTSLAILEITFAFRVR